MNKAFFLDRDGIIIEMIYNISHGNIHTALNSSQIKFVHGIFKLLNKTKNLNYKNIIISNQPDIGLKKISINNFKKNRQKINQILQKKGIQLEAEYYCFHHPFAKIAKYRQVCDCRKPAPGLLFQAAKDNNIDLKNSFFIGDGITDVLAGGSAGCKTILLANISESESLRILEKKLKGKKPDYLVKNLEEVIKIIS